MPARIGDGEPVMGMIGDAADDGVVGGAGQGEAGVVLVFWDQAQGAVGVALQPLDGDAVLDPSSDHLLVEHEGVALGVVNGHQRAVVEDGDHRVAPDADAGEILRVGAPGVVDEGVAVHVGFGDFTRGAGGGGVLVMTVRTVADKRPRMTVSDKGIWFRDWDLDVVPWGEIRKVYMTGIRIKITICVELRNPKRFVATMSPAQRSRLKTNSLIRLPVLRIPPKVLSAPVDEVLAALQGGLAP